MTGRGSGKHGKDFNKYASSEEIGGEEIYHHAHFAFASDLFQIFCRVRKETKVYDSGAMPRYTFPGSESSECNHL